MAGTIAIIGALEKEVRRIHDAIEDGRIAEEAGLRIARGTYHGMDVVATVAGMGTVNAAAAAQHLISAYRPDTLIFSGIAGGLNPALHIGDVVIGECLRYLDTDTALVAESAPGLEEFASSAELVALAERALAAHGYRAADARANAHEGSCPHADAPAPRDDTAAAPQADGDGASSPACAHPATPADDELRYLRGTIATGNRFVTGAEAKRDAVRATAADCVEMEGAAIAHVAAKNGVPCLVLRAISDNCDESYDALSARTFDLEDYARSASELVLSIVRELAEMQR